jgi:hypothetical protein
LVLLRAVAFILGFILVAETWLSAIKTFVLPRSARDPLTGFVFGSMRWLFNIRLKRVKTYAQRDRILAFYAPFSLLALLPTWLFVITLGYTGMYWALGVDDLFTAFRISGSSLLTLGFASQESLPLTLLDFTEATLGLMMIALLIAYLPSMYSAFSRREAAVALLEVRAGKPPSAEEMIIRFHRIHGLDKLGDQWQTWETWFTEVEESHTSLAALVFFRSPQADRSWVTAAGTVLDAAALARSSLDLPPEPRSDLCIRAGYLCLRHIADFFSLAYHPDPHYPDQPISVSRADYEAAIAGLEAAGVPLKADRELAWRDFAGWRVNYDQALIALADLTMAPDSPWIGTRLPSGYYPLPYSKEEPAQKAGHPSSESDEVIDGRANSKI